MKNGPHFGPCKYFKQRVCLEFEVWIKSNQVLYLCGGQLAWKQVSRHCYSPLKNPKHLTGWMNGTKFPTHPEQIRAKSMQYMRCFGFWFDPWPCGAYLRAIKGRGNAEDLRLQVQSLCTNLTRKKSHPVNLSS